MKSTIKTKLLAGRLRSLIRGDVFEDRVTRLLYSTDASIYRLVPLAVVAPRDAEDVSRLMVFSREYSIPLAARGAGTGLAGESLSRGIILDFSRYMTNIQEVNCDEGWVLAQPGAILDTVNQQAGRFGFQFGPDPASASRATVGGAVSNNATGAHSLRYGYCSDNLVGLQAVLADGRIISSGDSDWNELENTLYSILGKKQRTIKKYWPEVARNRAGYNLKGALHNKSVDLLKLLPGSEGTLGIFTEIKLKLVKVPSVKILLSANFDDLIVMSKSLSMVLGFDPSAVELMDESVLKLARSSSSSLAKILPDAKASLMIEFDGEYREQTRERMEECHRQLRKEFGSHVDLFEISDPVEQRRHWSARKNAVPLLFRQGLSGKPVPIIEDVAVDPAKMPEYLEGLQAILDKHQLTASYYAHAGSGELHVRPFLNLRNGLDRSKLSMLAKETFELAWSLGGTISGEHGIGLARSWALRKQYGSAYDLMEQVKSTFDPFNSLNPGKIMVDDSDLPLDNLRDDLIPNKIRNQGSLHLGDKDIFSLSDICNGCGECKSYDPSKLMCPVFRAVGDEYSSPRGKANLLREYLTGGLCDADLLSPQAQMVMENCILCGNCLRECPSGVQIPQLMVELRAKRNKLRGKTFTERFLVESEYMEWLASKFAPISNYVTKTTPVRKFMEQIVGIDSRRTMPDFAFPGTIGSLQKIAKRYKPDHPQYRAVWFVDLFAHYHDKQLAEDIIKVCSINEIELIIPEQCGCDMPAIAYGHLENARRAARFNAEQIAKYLDDVDMVLSFEPTATYCLQAEYKHLIKDGPLNRIAEKTRSGCEFLWDLHTKDRLKIGSNRLDIHLAYHCPCHLRVLDIDEPGYKLLGLIEGVEAEHLPKSCCGLAGTYGMRREKYDLSAKIAEPLREALAGGNFNAITSECSSCRMQLRHISLLEGYHPIQLLASWYSQGKTGQ